MTRLTFLLALTVLSFNIQPASGDEKSEKPALPNLVGTWAYMGGERDGNVLDEEHFGDQEVIISDKSMRLISDALFVFDYELKAGETATIDLTMTESPFGAGATSAGIVKIDGDELHLCYNPTGGDRPAAFKAEEGSGLHLFKLKRQPVEADKLEGEWKLTRGRKNGEDIPEDRLETYTVTITDKVLTLQGGETFVMSYTLDAKKNPPTMEMTITESPFGPGSKAKAIIQQLGDGLILCYSITEEGPSEFSANEDSGRFLFVLEAKTDDSEKETER